MFKEFIKHLSVLFLALCQLVFPMKAQELLHLKASPKKSKKPDRRVFSQEDFDTIMDLHSRFIEHNASCERHMRLTQKDLAIMLNDELGFDKTVSAYAPVWNGKVNRENLPVKRKI